MRRALLKPAPEFEAQCRADLQSAPCAQPPDAWATAGEVIPLPRQHFSQNSVQLSPLLPDSPEVETPPLPRGALRRDLMRAIHNGNPVRMAGQLVGLIAVFWLIELGPQIIAYLGTP